MSLFDMCFGHPLFSGPSLKNCEPVDLTSNSGRRSRSHLVWPRKSEPEQKVLWSPFTHMCHYADITCRGKEPWALSYKRHFHFARKSFIPSKSEWNSPLPSKRSKARRKDSPNGHTYLIKLDRAWPQPSNNQLRPEHSKQREIQRAL